MAKGRRGEYVVLPRIEQVFSESLAKTCAPSVEGTWAYISSFWSPLSNVTKYAVLRTFGWGRGVLGWRVVFSMDLWLGQRLGLDGGYFFFTPCYFEVDQIKICCPCML